jgi:hypothetical protein
MQKGKFLLVLFFLKEKYNLILLYNNLLSEFLIELFNRNIFYHF